MKNRSFHFTNKFIRSYRMDIFFALRTDEFYLNCSSRKTSNLSRSCNISRTKSTRNLPKHLKQALTIVRSTCLLNELNQPTKLSSLAFRLIISGGKINRAESRDDKDHGDKAFRTKRSWKYSRPVYARWRFLLSARFFFPPPPPPPRGRSLPLANPRDGRIWTSWQLLRRLR